MAASTCFRKVGNFQNVRDPLPDPDRSMGPIDRVGQDRVEPDLTPVLLTLQFRPVRLELSERPVPIPLAALDKPHHKEVFVFLQFRETVPLRIANDGLAVDRTPNIRVPTLEQFPAQCSIWQRKMQHHVEPSGSLECGVDTG